MQGLSPEQFKAVVAHELGHLSGHHGRFGAWIYRVSRTWDQLLERAMRQRGSWVFTLFFKWYAPLFDAYSFALRRAQEYEADRAAARIAGPRALADALMSVTIKGAYLEDRYWPEVGRYTPSLPLALALARFFHTTVEEMFDGVAKR